MQLKEVCLTNFRSYKGVHIFKPRLGASFILGKNTDEGYSSNGGGKTSLLSAIAWCLYGELATGASKDAVIHYGEPEVVVEARFEGLTVRRGKKRAKPESLEFFADELGGWVREDLDQTQNKLDSFLGVGKELFYNAFWLDNASKTVQFLFKRPAERLQALQDLLGEGFFSQAKKEATRKRQEKEKALSVAEMFVDSKTSQITDLRERIAQQEFDLHTYEKQVEKSEEGVANKILDIQKEIQKIKEDIVLSVRERDKREESSPYDLEEVIKRCAVIEAQASSLEEKISRSLSGKSSDFCPTCLRPLDGSDKNNIESERSRILREVSRLRAILEEERKKKDRAKRDRKEIDRMSEEIVGMRTTTKVLEKQLEALKNSSSDVARSALEKLKDSIIKDRECLARHKKEVEEKKKDISILEKEIPRIKFWEEGFGSKGVQNLLLDDVRSLLTQFTRNYLSHFSGEVLKVVYPKSDKGFEIITSYRDRDTPVSSLSRGEIGRANMAVLLALRKMLLYMRRSKIDFVVLDDAVSDLDESGTQSIVDLADALTKEVGNVFVTVPQRISSIKPDLLVQVEKKDGVSCIKT